MKVIELGQVKGPALVQKASNDGIRGKVELTAVALSHCLLQDKYLRDVTFRTGKIEHCRFEHTNLRNAVFDRVNLTGSRFVACDLAHTRFENCVLWYVVFERCELDYESVISSLPPENNICKRLLSVLRMNAESMGEKTWADRILLRELAAERQDLRDAIRHASPYYVKNYDVLDRLVSVFRLSWHYVRFGLWGYGIYLSRLMLSATGLLLVLATIVSRDGFRFVVAGESATRSLSWLEGLYFCVINLTTVGFGDISPANGTARVLASLTAVCGVILFGFIAAAFYRRLGR